MGLVSGIVVHHVVDDVPTVASSVIGGAIGDVDLGLHLEMVLHFSKTFRGDVGRVATFDTRGSVDHSLFDLATADGGSSTHITAVGHTIDLDITRSLGGHVEGHDVGFDFTVVGELGNDFEVVFAKKNVLKVNVFVDASLDTETIAEIALLTKGHGVFMNGLSFWGGVFPSKLGWERIAVPFSSAWKRGNRVVHIVASVFEIGLLSGCVDFLSGIEIGGDHEAVASWLRGHDRGAR